MSPKEDNFRQWKEACEIADEEVSRLHGMLNDAKERRLRCMVEKNNAWGEWQMEIAQTKSDA